MQICKIMLLMLCLFQLEQVEGSGNLPRDIETLKKQIYERELSLEDAIKNNDQGEIDTLRPVLEMQKIALANLQLELARQSSSSQSSSSSSNFSWSSLKTPQLPYLQAGSTQPSLHNLELLLKEVEVLERNCDNAKKKGLTQQVADLTKQIKDKEAIINSLLEPNNSNDTAEPKDFFSSSRQLVDSLPLLPSPTSSFSQNISGKTGSSKPSSHNIGELVDEVDALRKTYFKAVRDRQPKLVDYFKKEIEAKEAIISSLLEPKKIQLDSSSSSSMQTSDDFDDNRPVTPPLDAALLSLLQSQSSSSSSSSLSLKIPNDRNPLLQKCKEISREEYKKRPGDFVWTGLPSKDPVGDHMDKRSRTEKPVAPVSITYQLLEIDSIAKKIENDFNARLEREKKQLECSTRLPVEGSVRSPFSTARK